MICILDQKCNLMLAVVGSSPNLPVDGGQIKIIGIIRAKPLLNMIGGKMTDVGPDSAERGIQESQHGECNQWKSGQFRVT